MCINKVVMQQDGVGLYTAYTSGMSVTFTKPGMFPDSSDLNELCHLGEPCMSDCTTEVPDCLKQAVNLKQDTHWTHISLTVLTVKSLFYRCTGIFSGAITVTCCKLSACIRCVNTHST